MNKHENNEPEPFSVWKEFGMAAVSFILIITGLGGALYIIGQHLEIGYTGNGGSESWIQSANQRIRQWINYCISPMFVLGGIWFLKRRLTASPHNIQTLVALRVDAGRFAIPVSQAAAFFWVVCVAIGPNGVSPDRGMAEAFYQTTS